MTKWELIVPVNQKYNCEERQYRYDRKTQDSIKGQFRTQCPNLVGHRYRKGDNAGTDCYLAEIVPPKLRSLRMSHSLKILSLRSINDSNPEAKDRGEIDAEV